MGIVRELEKKIREGWASAVELAIVYLGLGETGKAVDKLEVALEEPPFARHYYFSWLKVDPIWDPVRDDPPLSARPSPYELPQLRRSHGS